jgi:hypothetical protein
MKIDIVLAKSQINANDKTYNVISLANGRKVFMNSLEEFDSFGVGDTVLVSSEKYQKNGEWKTNTSIQRIKIG